MCFALPKKVLKIDGDWAWVESGGQDQKVNTGLIGGLSVGDYLFVHDDLAVHKLSPSEAREVIALSEAGHDHCHCHEE